MKKKWITTVLIIILLIVAFFAGIQYGKTKGALTKTNLSGNFQVGPNANVSGQRNMRGNAGFVNGQIISKDDQSITVKLADGGSKVILYTNSTEINKLTSGNKTDLENGQTVMITGSSNSDGSLTAQSVQIRPSSTPDLIKNQVNTDTKNFTLTADDFSYNLKEIRVKKGDQIKIVLNNSEGTHDWVIDEFNARTKKIQAGQTDVVEFTADKTGTFEYYCSVGQHRQLGMKGNFIVE